MCCMMQYESSPWLVCIGRHFRFNVSSHSIHPFLVRSKPVSKRDATQSSRTSKQAKSSKKPPKATRFLRCETIDLGMRSPTEILFAHQGIKVGVDYNPKAG